MRRIFFSSFIIALLIILIGGFFVYRSLEAKRLARIRAQQEQKVEEVRITLVEGWTADDIAKYLETKDLFPAATFLSALKKVDSTQYPFLLSKPKSQGLEGFLFPDTYQVLKETTPETVIDKLLETFGVRFAAATKNATQKDGLYQIPGYEDVIIGNNSGPGLTPYQLVTLASIIEKETGRDVSKGTADQRARLLEERKTIAGIFYNRLAIGKALESDATINYITGKSDPSASGDDLAITSPYNTYRNAGLTPGPISNPSLSSLEAVLNPIETDYFYFLHKQPSGEVVYSKTFEEHRAKKFEFLK